MPRRTGGRILLLPRETCLNLSWHPIGTFRLLLNSVGYSQPYAFPHHQWSPVLWGATSGGVAYVRTDCVNMLSLLYVFLGVACLTTPPPRLKLLPWNRYMAICRHLHGGICQSSLFENPIHSSLSFQFKPPPCRLVIFRPSTCCPSQECILPMLILVDWSSV